MKDTREVNSPQSFIRHPWEVKRRDARHVITQRVRFLKTVEALKNEKGPLKIEKLSMSADTHEEEMHFSTLHCSDWLKREYLPNTFPNAVKSCI